MSWSSRGPDSTADSPHATAAAAEYRPARSGRALGGAASDHGHQPIRRGFGPAQDRRRVDAEPDNHDDERHECADLAPIQIGQLGILRLIQWIEKDALDRPQHVRRGEYHAGGGYEYEPRLRSERT